MTKAVDPFEEYLRKKKVELLESQFREQAEDADAQEEDDFVPPSNDDPEVEARIEEEADEFFTAGKQAGASLFSEADTGLNDQKVGEIRDALEDVFEEDAAQPRTEDQDQTFVDFFKQVRDVYAGDLPEPSAEPIEDPAQDEATCELAAPAPPHPDLSATAAELSTEEVVAVESSENRADARLDLSQILTPLGEEDDLAQRLDLIGRLVVKLVERAKLCESEIVEVLIKSGVEF